MQIDKLPIVETSTLEMLIVDLEAQWLNQMQWRKRRGAQSRDAPRVRWDLGFEQDDLHV
jgi:hypothetical protein